MPFLDAIPVNVFILGTSVLAGVILFLILTQIPDEEEEMKEKDVSAKEDMQIEPASEEIKTKTKPTSAKKKTQKKR